MWYLLVLTVLMFNPEVYADEILADFTKQERYEVKQQEKLFGVARNEAVDMENTSLYSDLSQLPYYPVIKIDFFNIFHTKYYEDKTFTYVLKNNFVGGKTPLGIRLRMSVGHTP